MEDPAGARISTSATMSSTPTSAPSTGSMPSTFDGLGPSLPTSLSALARRFRGLPLAGVLLFTDGNQTDTGDVDWSQLPPIYPVVPPSRGVARDIGVGNVSISQTNFEAAPGRPPRRRHGRRLRGRVDRRRRHRRGRARTSSGRRRRPRRTASRWASGSSSGPTQEASASTRSAPSPRRTRRRREGRAATATASSEQTLGQQQPARRRRPGGRPVPRPLRRAAGRTGSSSSSAGRSTTTTRSSSSACCGSPGASRNSTSRRTGRRTTSPLYDGFDHPDAETPNAPISRSWSAWHPRRRGRAARRLPQGRPTNCIATTRSSSTTSRPAFFTPDQLALLRNFVSQSAAAAS